MESSVRPQWPSLFGMGVLASSVWAKMSLRGASLDPCDQGAGALLRVRARFERLTPEEHALMSQALGEKSAESHSGEEGSHERLLSVRLPALGLEAGEPDAAHLAMSWIAARIKEAEALAPSGIS